MSADEWEPLVVRAIAGPDFGAARAVVDGWFGRPVGPVMHRLFFEQLGPSGIWIERGGAPVGFLLGLISEAEPDLAYVHFHVVSPAARGAGIGRRLYAEFGARMQARGCRRIRALAPLWNSGSIAFHERLGFAGERRAGYVGPGEDRIVFERALPLEPG